MNIQQNTGVIKSYVSELANSNLNENDFAQAIHATSSKILGREIKDLRGAHDREELLLNAISHLFALFNPMYYFPIKNLYLILLN